MGRGFDSTTSSGLGGCGAASVVLAVAGACVLVAVGETGRGAAFGKCFSRYVRSTPLSSYNKSQSHRITM